MKQWLTKVFAKLKPVKMYQLPPVPEKESKTDLIDKLSKKKGCADCGGRLLKGPSGGMNVNVKCTDCGSEFNIAIFNGDIMHAERI